MKPYGILAALLLAPLAAAQAADYAREQRWADEILPALVVGDGVRLPVAGREVLALHVARPGAPLAIVLVHGKGVHPDWGLVGELRMRLAERGHATLSVQMPVLAPEAPFEAYAGEYPEAGQRLAAAVAYLRGAGHRHVAIVAHSLGARMADEYLAAAPEAAVAAWVALGLAGRFASAPAARPVLDVVAASELPPVAASAPARAAQLTGARRSRQIVVPGADHFFTGREAELAGLVDRYLRDALDLR